MSKRSLNKRTTSRANTVEGDNFLEEFDTHVDGQINAAVSVKRRRGGFRLIYILIPLICLAALGFYFKIGRYMTPEGRALRFSQEAERSASIGDYQAAKGLMEMACNHNSTPDRKGKLALYALALGDEDSAATIFAEIPEVQSEEIEEGRKLLDFYQALNSDDYTTAIPMIMDDNFPTKLVSVTYLEKLVQQLSRVFYVSENGTDGREAQSGPITKEALEIPKDRIVALVDRAIELNPEDESLQAIRIDAAINTKDLEYLKQENVQNQAATSKERSDEVIEVLDANGASDDAVKFAEQLLAKDALSANAVELLKVYYQESNQSDKLNTLMTRAENLGLLTSKDIYDRLANSNGNLNNHGLVVEDRTNKKTFYIHHLTLYPMLKNPEGQDDQALCNKDADRLSLWEKQIYFQCPSENNVIYRVPETGGEVQLVYGDSALTYTIISNQLYVAREDGAGIDRVDLTNLQSKRISSINAKEVASNGIKLYFVDGNTGTISSMNFDGSDLKQLNEFTAKSIQPIGSKIYYLNLDTQSTLNVYDLQRNSNYNLLNTAHINYFNVEEGKGLNEETIFYSQIEGIFRCNAFGEDLKQISESLTTDINLLEDAVIYRDDQYVSSWQLHYLPKTGGEEKLYS